MSDQGVEVRIRHIDDTRSVYLADVPLFEIPEVIPFIRSWGGFAEDATEELTGTFVYDPDNSPDTAYFEVLIES